MADEAQINAILENPMWPRGMYGCPQDMFSRKQMLAAIDAAREVNDA